MIRIINYIKNFKVINKIQCCNIAPKQINHWFTYIAEICKLCRFILLDLPLININPNSSIKLTKILPLIFIVVSKEFLWLKIHVPSNIVFSWIWLRKPTLLLKSPPIISGSAGNFFKYRFIVSPISFKLSFNIHSD